MARIAAGPKTKRGAMTVGGALAIIFGWFVGDVLGYTMPDYVLQAWTVVIVAVINEWSSKDEGTSRSSGNYRDPNRVREPEDSSG